MSTLGDTALPDRFWQRVAVAPSGCWEWTGARLVSGYGSFRWEGRAQVSHRVAWTVLVGPIQAGLQMDHLCRNRACCNPVRAPRGHGFSGLNAAKDECPQGHAYTPENTYRRPSAPTTRECRICRKANRARHYAKERAA